MSVEMLLESTRVNSYVTVDEADDYLERFSRGAAWDAFSDDDKEDALVQAFETMEQEDWKGCRQSRIQPAQWPRELYWVYDEFIQPRDSDPSIPKDIDEAQMELANHILQNDAEYNSANTNAVMSESFGDVSIDYVAGVDRLKNKPRAYKRKIVKYTKSFTADGSGMP